MNSEFLKLPHFDPTIFTFGDSNIGLRWYGLMYLLGFIFARWLAVRRANQPNSGWTVEQVDTLLFNGFMGVFLGGRIGDVFFYNFDHFVQDPLYLFRVWEGECHSWWINWGDYLNDLDLLFSKKKFLANGRFRGALDSIWFRNGTNW